MPSAARSDARWLDGVVVVMPAYMYMGNIYHFSFLATFAVHLASAIPALLPSRAPSRKVVLLFRGEDPNSLGLWQKGVLSFLINHRLKPLNLTVSLETFHERDADRNDIPDTSVCMKSALLVGKRIAMSIWPFPNATYVSSTSPLLQIEALSFRHAAYLSANLPTLLPNLPAGALSSPPQTTLLDLPPRTVGYARRNRMPDPPEGELVEGTTRRFSDADEKWFVSMLQEEARKANFSYETLQTDGEQKIEEQVRMYAQCGVIAGIHGANLMNVVFTPAFSSVLEIGRMTSMCYRAGANSGLFYTRYAQTREATPEESGCREDDVSCFKEGHQRKVLIDSDEDRVALRNLVRTLVKRTEGLHRRFAHLQGVPVQYVEHLAAYRIDWSRAKPKS